MAGSPKVVVTISPLAKADVDAIARFLEESWSPEVAIRFITAFYQKVDSIELSPGLGTPLFARTNTRKIPVDRYNIIYYEWPEEYIVEILRVIDRRSNPADNPFA